MRDKELYQRILGVEAPWRVADVELELDGGEVRVRIVHEGKDLSCPECGKRCPGYDHRSRRWRHLDTCQYRTVLLAQVPRVQCPEHGVHQVRVPWGEPGSRFTALYEALIIDWLQEASISAVARQLKLTWSEVDTVLARAVRRGLARRERKLPTHLGIDETSFQKRHEYVTVVGDQRAGVVVHVADDRGRDSLDSFYAGFSDAEREAVESVAMDMWGPYIASTEAHIPNAETKIAFDKFHIAQHLGNAVDQVRRQEHKVLLEQGDGRLKRSKYLWLQNPDQLSAKRDAAFEPLRNSSLKTARAWAIKELAMEIWNHAQQPRWAWEKWYSWAIRSQLEPIKKVARMIKRHLQGIVTAIEKGVTNARAEGLNAKIQALKFIARGYRNRERFRTMIYFHLGGLDLYPAGIRR